jgi:GalNAc-alpha-(1->4)-GalNAc-alpha-(1->3)-diNAcBac-PP-undecaprenol alpha-1,4-N-acetyl-D-galactosaminyltransferase
MTKTKSICIALPTLICGGTERTASLLANYFAQKEYKVTVLILFNNPIFYELNSRIEVRKPILDRRKTNKYLYLIYLIPFIRKQLKIINPDRLFILGYISLFLFSLVGSKRIYKIFISNRASPLRSLFPFYQTIRNVLYKKADGIIAQTAFAAVVYKKRIHHKNIRVIPNFLREVKKHDVKTEKIILTVGRLVPEKGHEYLIKAFSRVEVKDWTLVIVGGGYLESKLKELVNELKLNEKVIFTGFSNEVDLWLSKAGIFVLSSVTEGYPNALIEAMSLSISCISFDCVAGPSEIIRNNENGFLVPACDILSLSTAISNLVNNDELRTKIGNNASAINYSNNFLKLAGEYENFIFS